jgi:aminopeptidase N
MEHQTAIAFSEPSKDSKSVFELLGYDLKYNLLILHETAHEWWGNSVSASTRNDLWINESMATYTEALFVEYLKGYAESIKYINQDLAFIISNKFPLCDTVNSSKYTTDIYMKGSAFWNTLRSIINDDKKWFSFLLEIQSEYAYKSISTKELITFTNKFFNTNYFYLFNQYIYNYDLPILEIKNYASHVKTVTCRWRNCSDDFIMPLRLGNENIQIIPNTQWQTFSIPSDTVILPEYLTQHYLMNVKFIEEK